MILIKNTIIYVNWLGFCSHFAADNSADSNKRTARIV